MITLTVTEFKDALSRLPDAARWYLLKRQFCLPSKIPHDVYSPSVGYSAVPEDLHELRFQPVLNADGYGWKLLTPVIISG